MALAMIANIVQMNLYFLIVTAFCLVFLAIIFVYLKTIIIQAKQLDLKLKTPVFNKLNQAATGLIQLRLFGNLENYIKEINRNITDSFRANIFYWFNTRILGVSVSFIVSVALVICFISGITLFETSGLYATSIIYLTLLLEFLQWFFRNLANAQSMLASVSRCFTMIEV